MPWAPIGAKNAEYWLIELWQVWGECDGGNEVVGCVAQYGHSYPWHGETEEENRLEIEGFKITWDFMKTHKNSLVK